MLRTQIWWAGDEREGLSCSSAPERKGDAVPSCAFRIPSSPAAVWAALRPHPSSTDLLSELHPGAGDRLGARHFTQQLHGLSSTHLPVLGKLNDLRGHGWRGQAGK